MPKKRHCPFCGKKAKAVVEYRLTAKVILVCLECLGFCQAWQSLYRIVAAPTEA